MKSIAKTQQWFQRSVLAGQSTIELGDNATATVSGHFEIYINAYCGRLVDALRDNYPGLHRALGDDGTAVVLFVHVVDRHRRCIGPAGEHRLVHPVPVHPGPPEFGERGRVDINHPMAETGDHLPGDSLQIAGEHDEVGAGPFQGSDELGRVGGIRKDTSWDARPAGAV